MKETLLNNQGTNQYKKYIEKFLCFFLGIGLIGYSLYLLNYHLSRPDALRLGLNNFLGMPYFSLVEPIIMLLLGIGFFIFGFLKSKKPLFLSLIITSVNFFMLLILFILNLDKPLNKNLEELELFVISLLFFPIYYILLFISLILLIIAYFRVLIGK